MDNCCSDCFLDGELQSKVNNSSSTVNNSCDFCSGRSTKVVPVQEFKIVFEAVIDALFEKSTEDGCEDLSVLMQKHLLLFSDGVASQSALLKEIIDDENTYDGSTTYKLIPAKVEHTNLWSGLRNELIHENRFFPRNSLLTSLFRASSKENMVLRELVQQLTYTVPARSTGFYRARISDEILTDSDIGKPPSKVASDGRANPSGIAYLYTADDLSTAISEVRPSIANTVCVAQLRASQKLSIIDLTEPRRLFCPTTFEGEEVSIALSLVKLLEALSKDLSVPVSSEKKLDYLPTQFFCEFLKSLGTVQGVKYQSSFTGKGNIVFFEPSNASFFSVDERQLFRIQSTSHSYESVDIE